MWYEHDLTCFVEMSKYECSLWHLPIWTCTCVSDLLIDWNVSKHTEWIGIAFTDIRDPLLLILLIYKLFLCFHQEADICGPKCHSGITITRVRVEVQSKQKHRNVWRSIPPNFYYCDLLIQGYYGLKLGMLSLLSLILPLSLGLSVCFQ